MIDWHMDCLLMAEMFTQAAGYPGCQVSLEMNVDILRTPWVFHSSSLHSHAVSWTPSHQKCLITPTTHRFDHPHHSSPGRPLLQQHRPSNILTKQFQTLAGSDFKSEQKRHQHHVVHSLVYGYFGPETLQTQDISALCVWCQSVSNFCVDVGTSAEVSRTVLH